MGFFKVKTGIHYSGEDKGSALRRGCPGKRAGTYGYFPLAKSIMIKYYCIK